LPPAGRAAGRHRHARVCIAARGHCDAGAASTAGYFALNDWNWEWDSGRAGFTQVGAAALTTVGCAALSPIVATAVLNRPLTQREAAGGLLPGADHRRLAGERGL
jgi:hypothetical protein